MGRFINADTFAATGQGLLGNNMFAYCLNNPVCRKDISGTTSVEIFDPDGNPLRDDDREFAGGRMGNGGSNEPTESIGGGHGHPEHKSRINDLINNLKKSGRYLKIYGNRSLKTAGLTGTQRPDVIAVGRDGRVEVWEFASPSQAVGTAGYAALKAKIEIMHTANPSVTFHEIIHW